MATLSQKIARHAGALNRLEDVFALPVTATANSDFIFAIPATARNLTFRTKTTTAYTAGTDATVQVGKTAAGAEYVAAVSIKAQGEVAHTIVTTGAPDLDTYPGNPGAMTILTARVIQTGTPTAVGAANLYVAYSLAL